MALDCPRLLLQCGGGKLLHPPLCQNGGLNGLQLGAWLGAVQCRIGCSHRSLGEKDEERSLVCHGTPPSQREACRYVSPLKMTAGQALPRTRSSALLRTVIRSLLTAFVQSLAFCLAHLPRIRLMPFRQVKLDHHPQT